VPHPSMVDQLSLGDHVCWACQDDEERTEVLAHLVEAGLRDGQRVVVNSSTGPLAATLAGLAGHGVRVVEAIDRDQLRVVDARPVYLAAGGFDPVRAIDTLIGEVVQARQDHWNGLCSIVDMAWSCQPAPGSEYLDWYEAQINRVVVGGQALRVCLYDRRRFSPTALERIASTHPTRSDDPVPLMRLRRGDPPVGLRIAGESDLSNRRALACVLGSLLDDLPVDGRPVAIDLAGLTFADCATASLLLRTSVAAAPTGLRLVGCSPAVARLLKRLGAERVAGLTVEESTGTDISRSWPTRSTAHQTAECTEVNGRMIR